MTVGVYGLVAGIVKLDDFGLYLSRQAAAAMRLTGRTILHLAPRLMKALSLAGTAAMFLVGGGIVSHGIAPVAELREHLSKVPGWAGTLLPIGMDALLGVAVGAVVLLTVKAVQPVFRRLLPRTSGRT